MIRTFIFTLVALASTQSFAFDLSDFSRFGCQNYQGRVSIDLENQIMTRYFFRGNIVYTLTNIKIDEVKNRITFQASTNKVEKESYSLENIIQGHKLGIIYADLFSNGQKQNGCAGYLN